MDAVTLSGILLLTVMTYLSMQWLHRRLLPFPWAHPLVLTVGVLSLCCWQLGISIQVYREATQAVHWFLGPVTVALAVPVYQQWHNIKTLGKSLSFCILLGGIIAPVFAWLALWTVSAPLQLQLTMLVKSITTPLAMGAASEIGGIPALAAVIVIVTGIVGASAGQWMFRWFKVSDKRAQGVALGAVAHAVGTAKAVSESSLTGAFASVALCINGVVTAILVPFVYWLLAG